MVDLALGTSLMVGVVGAIGWLLSGIGHGPGGGHSYQQAEAVYRRRLRRAVRSPSP
jgi:hypothetical protein